MDAIKICKLQWLVLVPLVAVLLVGCGYTKLLRPSVLKQLNPDVVALVNELPEVDHPNEAILGRLFVHGGLTHADVGDDGVMRAAIRVPLQEYIWKPAIIVMPHGGRLQVDISNDDVDHHMAFMPSDGGRRILDLPGHTRGRIEINLMEPGLYWFGCPVADHAGRGMLGLIVVKGYVPPAARLDRPPQPQP
ncbi:MAG TPA: MSMEG_3727 family PQQ-associated protein [Gammaproteobacteria bacterium]|nr:MSMEG_3727 family PQQ-associated protein [Gammaproteobacteria bacterium]